MNRIARPLLIAISLAFAASHAVAADKKPGKADLPPPPGLNDPGVSTPPGTAPGAAGADPAAAAEDPLAPVGKPDSRLVRDKASRTASANADRMAASEVTRRKQDGDTVEEYRQNGRVWMIRIVPQDGTSRSFYDADGSGRLNRDSGEGPISPVYYSLYEWK